MGMYRTLITSIQCLKWDSAFEDDIQFSTDRDRQETYRHGEELALDDQLRPGREFEAWYTCYCPECTKLYLRDQHRACFEELADLVAHNSIVVQRRYAKAEDRLWLQLHQAIDRRLRQQGWPCGYALTRGDGVVVVTEQPGLEFRLLDQ